MSVSALAGLAAALFARRETPASPDGDIDPIEFPAHRAHVYYARPDEAIEAVIAAAKSIGLIDETQRGDQSVALKFSRSDYAQPIALRVDCLPLGLGHTRVVIRSTQRMDLLATADSNRAVRLLQTAMDTLLTGG